MGQVKPAEATERLLEGQPSGASVPVVLFARLAVEERHHDESLGRSLLQDALLRCAGAAKAVGIKP